MQKPKTKDRRETSLSKQIEAGYSRRAFLATAAFAVSSQQFADVATAGPGDMAVATEFERKRIELLKFVHPDVLIDRRPIPADKNAYGLLCEAGKKLTTYSDFAGRYCQQHGIGVLDGDVFDQVIGADDGYRYPTGEAAKCLTQWLADHRFVSQLVEQLLQRGNLQLLNEDLFEFLGKDFKAFDLMSAMREIARYQQATARQLFARRRFVDGNSMLWTAIRLGRLLCDSDSFVVHFLMGSGITSAALQLVQSIALDLDFPAEHVAKLVQVVDASYPSLDSFIRCNKIEVCYYFVPEIVRLPDAADLAALVDHLLKRFTLFGFDAEDNFFVTEKDVQAKRRAMLTILDDHPAPLDKPQTVRIFSRFMAEVVQDLGAEWLRRNQRIGRDLRDEMKVWPPQASFMSDIFSDLTEEGEAKKKPLPTEQLQAAKHAVRKIENPVGKMLASDVTSYNHELRRVYHIAKLRSDMTRVVLALRLYLENSGRLPPKLEDLIEANLLKSVPIDPFSGEAIRYSRKRAIIWSYGVGEKDDGGDGDPDADSVDNDDLVWRIPQLAGA
jgi:hypothetical protein